MKLAIRLPYVLALAFLLTDIGGSMAAQAQPNRQHVPPAWDSLRHQPAPPRYVRPGLDLVPYRHQRDETGAPWAGSLEALGYEIADPVESWTLSPNPTPALNFDLSARAEHAGDVNGDGIDDYLYPTFAEGARDERTPDLTDTVSKVALFFGGDTPTEPDQVIYRHLVSVGDLNADGFDDAIAVDEGLVRIYTGSPSGYTDSGVQLVSSASGSLNTGVGAVGFMDLDGDGFDDVVLNEDFFNASGDFEVIFGAANLASATLRSYPGSGEEIERTFNVADLDGDGQAVIIQLTGVSVDFGGEGIVVDVFHFDADDRSRTTVQQFLPEQVSGFAPNIGLSLIEMTGAGPKEMLTQGFGAAWVFMLQPDGTFDETPLNISNLYTVVPIGDLDGDGRHDFFTQDNDGTSYLSFGPADLADGLSFDIPIPFEPLTHGNTYYDLYGGLGDLNGDGLDDAIFSLFDYSQGGIVIGRRFLYGNTDRSADIVDVQYPTERFFDRINATQAVGDLNADGIEDFIMRRMDLNEIAVFFGGASLSSTPDLTLSAPPEALNMGEAAAGDFNGDGAPDIAVSYDSQADVYFGGSAFDATTDHTIAIPSEDRFPTLEAETIGDVNGDGTDDLLLASDAEPESFLFFGASSLSATPDVTLSHPFSVTTATALGDFDGDGMEDFAVGFGYFGGVSAIHVYFGDPSPSFSSPDLVITPDAETGSFFFPYAMTGGDFNGDGFGDLAAAPLDAFPPLNVQVNVYYGGPDADATTDRHLTVPAHALASAFRGPSSTDADGDGFANRLQGGLTTVPRPEGTDALVATTYYATNALLYGDVAGTDEPTVVLRAFNQDAGLGGGSFVGLDATVAAGDFNDDDLVDLVVSQPDDNNDALSSSRVYRYVLGASPVATEPTVGGGLTGAYRLSAAYPNPFRDHTTFELAVREAQEMQVEVYDMLGRRVRMLHEGIMPAEQTRRFTLDASGLPAGVYLIRVAGEGFTESRKLVLVP